MLKRSSVAERITVTHIVFATKRQPMKIKAKIISGTLSRKFAVPSGMNSKRWLTIIARPVVPLCAMLLGNANATTPIE